MPRRVLSNLERARAIGQIEAGVPQKKVAANFGVSQGAISKLKAKFRQTGEVKDRPRSGRPKKTTPQEDRFITQVALTNRRLSSRVLQARFLGRFGRRISDQTVRNRLRRANLKARKPPKKRGMTALNRLARLRWCRQHQPWNLDMWRNVLFTDESRFCLRKLKSRVKVWRRRRECFADCCVNTVTAFGGGSILVWGGISLTSKTRLVIIEENVNAINYRDDILQPVAIPYLKSLGPNATLQDNNAHPHRARIIGEFLHDAGVQRMEWPANSPDLNPMEHMWDQLGRKVRLKVTDETTLTDLTSIVVEEWNAIPEQYVTRLVSSMRRRCQAVVSAYGSPTNY